MEGYWRVERVSKSHEKMNNHPKVLFVANIYSHHIYKFTKSLKTYNPNIRIDVLSTSIEERNIPYDYLYDNIYMPVKRYNSLFYKMPKVRGWLAFKDFENKLIEISEKKYDVINIHNISIASLCFRKYANQMTNSLILSPFGSEVLRMKRSKLDLYIQIFNKAKYITSFPTSVKSKIVEWGVAESKFVDLGYGSEVLDYLIENTLIDKNIAKNNFEINNCYAITCGYNGYKTQFHLQVIDAINKVKSQLPENYILLFPMTYGAPNGYIDEVRETLKRYNLKYKIVDQFLSDNDLISLQLCSDIFIHAQPTDNFSGSIIEYLYAGSKIVNASWVRYPILEKYTIPYYLFDSFDELGNTLVHACNNKNLVDAKTISYIEQFSRLNLIKSWSDLYYSCVNKQAVL